MSQSIRDGPEPYFCTTLNGRDWIVCYALGEIVYNSIPEAEAKAKVEKLNLDWKEGK